MYFAGTSIVLDVVCALNNASIRDIDEISHRIFGSEHEKQRDIPDIIRLPLKLAFPSLSLYPFSPCNLETDSAILSGPDDSVRQSRLHLSHPNSVLHLP